MERKQANEKIISVMQTAWFTDKIIGGLYVSKRFNMGQNLVMAYGLEQS